VIVTIARKPVCGSVTTNVHTYKTGCLNIDASRIAYPSGKPESGWSKSGANGKKGYQGSSTFRIREMPADEIVQRVAKGRWPANIILNVIVTGLFPDYKAGYLEQGSHSEGFWGVSTGKPAGRIYDAGSVARFFKQVKS
jgi:hypothetical protein